MTCIFWILGRNTDHHLLHTDDSYVPSSQSIPKSLFSVPVRMSEPFWKHFLGRQIVLLEIRSEVASSSNLFVICFIQERNIPQPFKRFKLAVCRFHSIINGPDNHIYSLHFNNFSYIFFFTMCAFCFSKKS